MVAYAELTPGLVASAGAIFAFLALVLTSLRLYTKRKYHDQLNVDDYLAAIAMVLVVGMGVATITGVALNAIAQPSPPPDPVTGEYAYEQSVHHLLLWVIDLLQASSLGFLKACLLFYYRAIFCVSKGWTTFNVTSIAAIVLVAVWSLSFFIAFALNCPGNPSAYWTSDMMAFTYCWDSSKFLLWYAYSDLATDILVFVFPLPFLWRLHMSRGRKLAVSAIFFIGGLAVAASATRAAMFHSFINEYSLGYDMMMMYSNGIYWMVIETGFAMCAVNLPVLYLLWRHASSKRFVEKLRSISGVFVSSRSRGEGSGGTVPMSWRRPAQKRSKPKSNPHDDMTSTLNGSESDLVETKVSSQSVSERMV